MLLVKPSGKTKVRKFDMAILIYQDIVWFDITSIYASGRVKRVKNRERIPMDKTKLVYGFDRHHALGDVKPNLPAANQWNIE
jgi:hypothetical protein